MTTPHKRTAMMVLHGIIRAVQMLRTCFVVENYSYQLFKGFIFHTPQGTTVLQLLNVGGPQKIDR